MSITDRVDAIRARLVASGVVDPPATAPWWIPRYDGKSMTAAIFDCWDDMRVLTIDDADGELVDFIANAPADLAWLLEENARLTGQVAELEADKTDLRACAEDYAAFEAERVAQVNFLNSLHTRSTAVTGEKS